jgi:hypothetical protein
MGFECLWNLQWMVAGGLGSVVSGVEDEKPSCTKLEESPGMA